MSNAKFVGSDLTVVLGSSLRVEPASTLSVMVNLQPKPCDCEANLVIRGTCDEVMAAILTTFDN